MDKLLLLGAEAIAEAAIDEGISGVYAYPGTPSTEITEYIQKSPAAKEKQIRSSWSSNEKTAYEAALGMSYAGKKSMVCMKHVGLNVAADPFMNSAVTGINGGLVLVVADDPSMHSSQNEQDTRYYGRFAYLPVLEPANQQEAYVCTRHAFELSELVSLPVILRITTRLSHSRAVIIRQPDKQQNALNPEHDKTRWVLLPFNARKRYANLLEQQSELVSLSENSPFNQEEAADGDMAVIAFGIAYNYVKESLQLHQKEMAVLKITQYPLPKTAIKAFTAKHKKILIAEEGFPVYEELLRGYFDNAKFAGRLDHTLPRTGELTPDLLSKALGFDSKPEVAIPELVANRPPELCKGCSHRDLYEALNIAFENYGEQHVFSDIGCYTLGALPPFNSINTCIDMGASITMAKGAADAGLQPSVAVIGDSTFTHSGMTGLLDAVNDKAAVTIIISDNNTTAMTGGQDSSGTDKLEAICLGMGLDKEHLKIIIPLKKNQEENIQILREEMDYRGPSVIIARRECIQTLKRKNRQKHKKS